MTKLDFRMGTKGKSNWGAGLFLLLFSLSLSFAFGIGYSLGRRPADSGGGTSARMPAAMQSPASSLPSSALNNPRPRAAEKPQTLWASVGGTRYTLYLASFQNFQDAEKEKVRLESRGLKGIEISEKILAGTGSRPWYRLNYGKFGSREEAVDQGRRLTERGLIQDFWPKEVL